MRPLFHWPDWSDRSQNPILSIKAPIFCGFRVSTLRFVRACRRQYISLPSPPPPPEEEYGDQIMSDYALEKPCNPECCTPAPSKSTLTTLQLVCSFPKPQSSARKKCKPEPGRSNPEPGSLRRKPIRQRRSSCRVAKAGL